MEKTYDFSKLNINENDIPVNYQWSGYVKNVEEYKEYNFLSVVAGEENIYICSSDNGVALGDYLSNYIFNHQYIYEIENVLSPGYNYWFFQAWERAEPWYDSLDDWMRNIVEYLIEKEYIYRLNKDDSTYFILSEIIKYEKQPLPESVLLDVEKICETSLLKYFEDNFENDDESFDENALLGDGGEWAKNVLEKFKLSK